MQALQLFFSKIDSDLLTEVHRELKVVAEDEVKKRMECSETIIQDEIHEKALIRNELKYQ
jgi:hypothetical protein